MLAVIKDAVGASILTVVQVAVVEKINLKEDDNV